MLKNEDFEAKLSKIQEVLEQLNQPDISLSKSTELYKEGLKNLKEASALLENAKLILEEDK